MSRSLRSWPELWLERLLGRLPIGWLQLSHSRTRLYAALGGVSFASLLVLMQLGFHGALLGSVALPYRAMDAQLLISAADMNTLADASPLPRVRLLQAAAVPGVDQVSAVFLGRLDWRQPDGSVRALDVLGFDPSEAPLHDVEIRRQQGLLNLVDTVLMDARTRHIDAAPVLSAKPDATWLLELRARSLKVAGHFAIGGGFSADGYLLASDQTFLRLFPNRSSGAPNLGLVQLQAGADPAVVAALLRERFRDAGDVKVRSLDAVIAEDQRFQSTQRPIGLIFGFGIVIGLLVGVVIVYQVLSSDVADHLKEYATLKAIGYPQRFFLGIVFEEAVILGLLGFVPGLLIASGLYAVVAWKTGLPMAMNAPRAGAVLLGTVAMCALSGAIATRRLARANPAELF
ncbi:ABC transporter permease [Paucibacter aquatile]|uniref:ABC transporter permease n=1 Tax=Kinneretia aquatilis TaxID=2070761 RepID=A0A2N8L140_9BURK|nr:ABC transporter permease DevC [Paucibacter aquatile]PND39411.1 ABC transporter permease [Paucibacter aquatile]